MNFKISRKKISYKKKSSLKKRGGTSRQEVLEKVRQNGFDLSALGTEFRKDRGIVMEAVKQDGVALQFASEELRNNREIVMEAVKQDGLALQFASESLQNDPTITSKTIKNRRTSGFIEMDEMMVFPFLNMANETERQEIEKNNPEQKTKYQEITKKNPENITDFYAFLYYMKMFIFRIEKHVLKWLGTDLLSIEKEYQNYTRFDTLSRVHETDPKDVYKTFTEKYYHYIGEMYRNLQKNYEEIVFPFLSSTDEQRERFRTSNDVQKKVYEVCTEKDPKDIVDYDAFLYYMAEYIFIIEHKYLDDLRIDMKYIEKEYEKYKEKDSDPNREFYFSRVRDSDPYNVYKTFREKYYHHIGEMFQDPNNKSIFSVLRETTSPFPSLIDSILKSAESQRHDDTSFTEDGQQSQSQTESSSPTESQHIQSVDKRKNVTIILKHKNELKEIEIKIPMETEIEHQINEILLNIQLDLSDTNLKDRFHEIGKLLPSELSQSEKNYIKLYIMKHLQDNSDYSGKILRHLFSRDPSTHFMEVLSIPEKQQHDYSIPKKQSLISRFTKKKKISESSNVISQLLSI